MFDFIKLQEKDVFLTLKNLIFLELLILMVAELCFLACFCRGTMKIKGRKQNEKGCPRGKRHLRGQPFSGLSLADALLKLSAWRIILYYNKVSGSRFLLSMSLK